MAHNEHIPSRGPFQNRLHLPHNPRLGSTRGLPAPNAGAWRGKEMVHHNFELRGGR